jgi:Xaa-Pro aminopeptidase
MESAELKNKLDRIQALLAQKKLDCLLLRKVSSVAWATGGAASYINSAVTEGTASLLITPNTRYLVTTNIEAPHYEKEEGLAVQGWQIKPNGWYQEDGTAGLAAGLKLGADCAFPGAVDLSNEISHLRADLLPVEQERFCELGRRCAAAMQEAVGAVKPGQTEYEIASFLAGACLRREVLPIVVLIATDERIFGYRHPLPTPKKMERYAMLVLCGRWKGLVCSLTRLVYFGKLPEELRLKADAVAHIDATFLAATRPGETLGKVFQRAVAAYADTGFAEEWKLHHQGGTAGYEPREYLGLPGAVDVVHLGQAYAWNPSITGTKSEDTILVGEKTAEVITVMPGWETIRVTVDGQDFDRPCILEVF